MDVTLVPDTQVERVILCSAPLAARHSDSGTAGRAGPSHALAGPGRTRASVAARL